jgi:hypothetical protein
MEGGKTSLREFVLFPRQFRDNTNMVERDLLAGGGLSTYFAAS